MARNYKVVKRNGDLVPLDITKIRKVIEWAAAGLDINPIKLESSMQMRFRNKMTTVEIQDNLIDTALNLTSIEEPEWRIVAARLKLMNLYKEIQQIKNYENFGYGDFLDHILTSIDKGIYDPLITEKYSTEEIKELGELIDLKYDMDFDYAGANMLINRYLLKDIDKEWELPQEALLTIAMLIEQDQPKEKRKELVADTYKKLAERKLSLATPMLMNLRKPYGNLSSCFITAMDDSRDSIFYAIDQISEISKNGGGVGLNISRIRCEGSWIKKTPDLSGGVIPWIKIVNDTVVGVNQQGKRCVSRDSEVEIKDKGQIKVTDVQVGDYIKSLNVDTNNIEYKRVNEVIDSVIDSEQVKIMLENGNLIMSENSKIYVTEDSKNWGYKQLKDIIGKTNLKMLDEKLKEVSILSIEQNKRYYEDTNFIDFNVEGNHNFFVKRPENEKMVLVHNSGACTVALDSWHYDFESFLDLQTENGDQRQKAFDIFPQAVLSDEFMRRVESNSDWYLVDPYEIRTKLGAELAELWGEEFEEVYSKIQNLIEKEFDDKTKKLYGNDFEKKYRKLIAGREEEKDVIKLVKRVKARELFKTMMKTQVETGMPYMTFKDAVNRANPNKHEGMIGNGNLCLSGDTKLLVRTNGNEETVNMEDLVKRYQDGEEFEVYSFNHQTNANEYRKVTDAFLTSQKAKVMKITDADGNYIICTPDHKVWTENRGYVEAGALTVDDELKLKK